MPDTATRERPLKSREKRIVAILGIPTLALALSTTVVTTYLPVVASGFVGSTVVIGVIVSDMPAAITHIVTTSCRYGVSTRNRATPTSPSPQHDSPRAPTALSG